MSYTNELPEWIREEIDMSLGKKLCPSITDKLLDAANLIEYQAARIVELEQLIKPGEASGMANALFELAEDMGMSPFSSMSPASYIRIHVAEIKNELAATRSELEAVKDRLRQIDRGDHADRI